MMNAIAIDDERIALSIIEHHALNVEYLNLIATFQSIEPALKYITTNKIDLVFLDIKICNENGLDFIKRLPYDLLIIFTTAYSEYAVNGFDLNIVDFLLKPFSSDRFEVACSRAKRMINSKQHPIDNFLFVRDNYSSIRIYYAEILFIEASGNYVNIHLENKKILVRLTMTYLENILDNKVFQRIHRSYIVNVTKINKLSKTILFVDNYQLPINKDFDISRISIFKNTI
jgi:two-component system LytT family response regulator